MFKGIGLDQLDFIVGSLIAAVTVAIGVWRFEIAQRWKKKELAADKLLRLATDPELEACLKILDWSHRPIHLPEKYKVICDKGLLEHSYDKLHRALRHESQGGGFSREEAVYRDIFDRFFEFLEELNHDIDIGLLSKDDVRSLKYWLDQLANPRFLAKANRSMFVDFMRDYEYFEVIELMEKFEIGNAIPRQTSFS